MNNSLKPNAFHIPLALTLLYIFMLVLSAFNIIFRDVERHSQIEQLIFHAYANIFLLILMLFYLFAFPVFYLIPNKLYFPFLYVKDHDANLIYHYSIGPGYCAQIVGFIFVVPYSMFYYTTVMNFQSQKDSAETKVNQYIKAIQEPLDLDSLIAKEQLKLKLSETALEDHENRDKVYVPSLKRRLGL